MLKHFKTTETDQVFDQIIYKEKYPNVPIKNFFLYSTLPESNLYKDRSNKQTYISPFRSKLTQEQIEWLQNLKNKRYSHQIKYPQYLNYLDTLQLNELNDIKLKEKKLEYYKKSQNVVKFEETTYKHIDNSIPLKKVPKVPSFTYQTGNNLSNSENPWATPENKESIIIYNGKFYSKPLFDNIQLQKLENKQYIDKQWKLCQDAKKSQISEKYEPKFSDLDKSIDSANQKLELLTEEIRKLDEYYENNLTQKKFISIASYNKEKNNKLNYLSKLRKVISEPPFVQQTYDNGPAREDIDSFEYETVEEIKYI